MNLPSDILAGVAGAAFVGGSAWLIGTLCLRSYRRSLAPRPVLSDSLPDHIYNQRLSSALVGSDFVAREVKLIQSRIDQLTAQIVRAKANKKAHLPLRRKLSALVAYRDKLEGKA